MNIKISVKDKRATAESEAVIVCGNSDYTVTFSFDEEWDPFLAKTARFVYVLRGETKHTDVVLDGNTASVPILTEVKEVFVGAYAGALHTTTPAKIPCEPSIRCGTSEPVDLTPSQYDQILELINDITAGGGTPYAVQFVSQTLTEEQQDQARSNIGAASPAEIGEAVNASIEEAKASGEFAGPPGAPGAPGKDGRGIAMFWQSKATTAPGDTNEWTIQYTDGTESIISVKNGENGTDGRSVYISSVEESYEDGGENIVTFGGTPVPMSVAIKNGSKGSPGDPGYTPQKNIDYFDGKDGYTPVKGKDYFDGKDGYTPVKGKDYFDGEDGTSVTVSNVSTSSTDGGTNTVTFSDGKTLTVKNGSKGSPGEPGTPGEDGRGIAMFWQSAHDPNPGGTNSWTIQYTDGTESVISVKNGESGLNGSSVYISSIKESTEDDGENVVTFGGTPVPMTLTIKNGSKGSAGKSAYQTAVDSGYSGTEAEFAELLLGNHEHAASAITSGALPLSRGGTGSSLSRTSNAIIRFSSSSDRFSTTATKSGAFYATAANGAPSFGTLPIAQGGTGATTAEGVLTNLGVTATASELNSLSGVSSNVQEQLSAKANTSTLDAHTGNSTVHITAAERTAWNNKAGDFSIEIYNGTSGNPKPVRFASFNYSTCNSENGLAVKISLVSGHGNGSSYAFLEDAIIKVTYQGSVSVDNFKYYGASAGTYDGAARQYGDIFWLVDTTNKIVDFYCLMGQYARVYQTPWKRLTYSTGGSVTQYTSCTVYSSGTMNWGNNTEIATLSDIPTSLPPADHGHTYLQNGTVGIKVSDSNEVSYASNANYIYFGYDNRMGSSGIVDTYIFGTHSGAANAAKGTIECGKVVENGTALTDKYLSKSGGTLTGELCVNGGDVAGGSKIVLVNGKGQITASGTQTLFGFTAASTVAVGHSSFILAMRGSNARPKYNSKDVALMGDLNRSTAVNAEDTNYTTLMARGTSLNSTETNPAVNGAIAWQYE